MPPNSKLLFDYFISESSKIEMLTFLDLITLENHYNLGLDFLNCFLIARNKDIIPDNHLNYLMDSDIIRSYKPKRKVKGG